MTTNPVATPHIVATWGKSVQEPEGSLVKKIAVPTKVKLPSSLLQVQSGGATNVVAVSCGAHFSALLTDSGHVYTYGSNKDGRLGHSSSSTVTRGTHAGGDSAATVVTVPKRIEALSNVVQVSCGNWHGICLTRDHQVYIWGKTTVQYNGPTLVQSLSQLAQSGDPVVRVGAGYAYSGALTASGRLFLWGKNQRGKMGFGPSVGNTVDEPRHLAGYQVRDFCLGYETTVFCTVQGQVYAMGSNDYYQLGNSNSNGGRNKVARDVPHRITTGLPSSDVDPVVQVSTSTGSAHNCHSGAVTASGALYMWGSGYKFKLGTGTLDDQPTPVRVTFFDNMGLTVKQLVCGGIHNQVITSNDQVYSWGCGSDGRLGHPESDGHRYLYKEEEPRQVEFVSQRRVMSLASSYYHVMAVVV